MENNKKKALSASEKILNAAERLFYEEGIQSVGIDRILKESGVAMNTLYKYFPSKDVLVEQYLKNRDIRWRKWFNSYIHSQASPKENILSLFDALNDWFHESDFRGCSFINAAGELGDTKPDIYKISREHKENVYLDVLKLCLDLNMANAEKIAKQLMILIEGAIVRAYLNGDQDAATYGKNIATVLLGDYE